MQGRPTSNQQRRPRRAHHHLNNTLPLSSSSIRTCCFSRLSSKVWWLRNRIHDRLIPPTKLSKRLVSRAVKHTNALEDARTLSATIFGAAKHDVSRQPPPLQSTGLAKTHRPLTSAPASAATHRAHSRPNRSSTRVEPARPGARGQRPSSLSLFPLLIWFPLPPRRCTAPLRSYIHTVHTNMTALIVSLLAARSACPPARTTCSKTSRIQGPRLHCLGLLFSRWAGSLGLGKRVWRASTKVMMAAALSALVTQRERDENGTTHPGPVMS